jgi:biopolymer transport protein ExbB/TolQ
MQIAFSTTVIGLLIAGVGLLIYSVKRQWFADEIAGLRYALDLHLMKEDETR